MTLDINAERCIYLDHLGKQYIITQERGHEFKDKPFRFVNDKIIILEFADIIFTFEGQQFESLLSTSSFGQGEIALTMLNFEANIPNTNITLKYDWSAGYSAKEYIWPSI